MQQSHLVTLPPLFANTIIYSFCTKARLVFLLTHLKKKVAKITSPGVSLFTTVLVVVAMAVACKKPEKIEGFDAKAWQMDHSGCQGKRKELSTILEPQRKKLKGLSEEEVMLLLGKPNKVQIMERQQKYYFYAISDSASCARSSLVGELKLRFGATNQVKEVLF